MKSEKCYAEKDLCLLEIRCIYAMNLTILKICFDLHMQKSHQGTDFHLFGLSTILTIRMAKINAVKQNQEEK